MYEWSNYTLYKLNLHKKCNTIQLLLSKIIQLEFYLMGYSQLTIDVTTHFSGKSVNIADLDSSKFRLNLSLHIQGLCRRSVLCSLFLF